MSIKYCRLYFWIAGAPEDRPGGPWWYRDFMSEEDRERFLDDVRPFLYQYVYSRNEEVPYHVDKGMLRIQPPPSCSDCNDDAPHGRCTVCGYSPPGGQPSERAHP